MSRPASFFVVLLTYAAAIFVFSKVTDHFFMQGKSPLFAIFWADIAATAVVFTFSFIFKNTSLYDPYWSVLPIVIAPLLALRGYTEGLFDPTRNAVIVALITLWGIRLTWNWARGWQGLHHIDWRYVNYEKKLGKWFWPFSFAGLQLLPTLLVFLGILPLLGAMTEARNDWNVLDIAATGLALLGISFEWIADNQLRHFRKQNPDSAQSLTTGLWKYSRHPNYFGEVCFWWALFLFALAANPAYWWTGIGALAMTALFHFVSIPMIEKRHLERRKDYPSVQQKIARWFPRPPRQD